MKKEKKYLTLSDIEPKEITEGFRYNDVKDYIDNNELNQEIFLEHLCNYYSPELNIDYKTFNNYLNNQVKNPNIEILKRIACEMHVSLDYLLYLTENMKNDNKADTEEAYYKKLGLTKQVVSALNSYRSFNCTDSSSFFHYKSERYNKALNDLFVTRIKINKDTYSFIELFNKYILKILISAITTEDGDNLMNIYATTYYGIVQNMYKYIYNKYEPNKLDYSLETILQEKEIRELYSQARTDLHNSIDTLLETSLKEIFGENKHHKPLIDPFEE